MSMADTLRRFGDEFAPLEPADGAVVSLSMRSGPLAGNVRLLPVPEYVAEVRRLARGD
jgi:hypothetical protein